MKTLDEAAGLPEEYRLDFTEELPKDKEALSLHLLLARNLAKDLHTVERAKSDAMTQMVKASESKEGVTADVLEHFVAVQQSNLGELFYKMLEKLLEEISLRLSSDDTLQLKTSHKDAYTALANELQSRVFKEKVKQKKKISFEV